MNTRTDSVLAIVAALFVLFTAMIDARASSLLSLILLAAFAVYKLVESRREQQTK